MRFVNAVATDGPLYSSVDLNGGADALVLDADGDTSISAPTDNQIDIEVAGADDFSITANSLNVLTGSALDLADSCQLRFGTGDDITMAWDGTDLDVLQATVNSSIKWGVSGAGIDQLWYGDTAAANMEWDQSADSLIFGDNAKVVFGTGSDVTIAWDGTDLDITCAADNSVITVGATGNAFDLTINGSDSSHLLTWDCSADDLALDDSCSLMFGTGNDVEIRWDATDLDILGVADDLVIKFGNGTNSFDIWVYGDTADDNIIFDASGKIINLDGIDMMFEDDDILQFGQTAGGDYWMYYDSGNARFSIYTTDSNGAGADAEVVRIPDGQLTVDGNSTFDDSAFDYVCEACGKHAVESFECCGKVEWHDDVALMAATVRTPGWGNEAAMARMEQFGLMTRDPDGSVFVSMNRMPVFLMSGMAQLYDRLNALEEVVASRG